MGSEYFIKVLKKLREIEMKTEKVDRKIESVESLAYFTAIGIGIALFAVFVLGLVVWVSKADATPFLFAEKPGSGTVEWYEVSFDGGGSWTRADGMSDGNLKEDLAPMNLADGQYEVVARACNFWGCGEQSDPFSFEKILPGRLGGLNLLGE